MEVCNKFCKDNKGLKNVFIQTSICLRINGSPISYMIAKTNLQCHTNNLIKANHLHDAFYEPFKPNQNPVECLWSNILCYNKMTLLKGCGVQLYPLILPVQCLDAVLPPGLSCQICIPRWSRSWSSPEWCLWHPPWMCGTWALGGLPWSVGLWSKPQVLPAGTNYMINRQLMMFL